MIDPSVLRQVPLFADLPELELERLAAGLQRRRYARGQEIFPAGGPGDSLFLVEEGLVKIALTSLGGEERILALLGPGKVFGDLALLDGKPRSAGAWARDPCQLLRLERERFLDVLKARPQVAIALLESLAGIIRRNTRMLQAAAFLSVRARLAEQMLELAGHWRSHRMKRS